ncbi:MAG: MFS transporter [Terracidiphilus sp.]|nr:MFS transporter [Terracidiphilus sp.]
MLWLVCFLNYADRQAIFALFPLLRVELHLSDMQLALVGSSFMWMYAAFGPVAGWLGDRLSRRGLILGGLFFWLCATTATILSRNYWQLTAMRALGGIAEAVYFPAAMSLISGYHGPETRSRAMSLHQSAVYVGTVSGGVLAAVAGERFGWRANFILFGSFGLVVFFLMLAFLKEPPRGFWATPAAAGKMQPSIPLRRALAEVLGSVRVLRLIAGFIGANFVAMIFMVWLPSFLFRKFHMSLSMAGMNATAYLAAASVVGVLCGGVLADKLASKGRGGRMKTQAFGLLVGAPFLFLSGWTPSVMVFIISMIGFGFCKGIYESNLWASLYDVVRPECRASAVGIMNSLGWLGGGVAPLVIAAASQHFGMGACLSATAFVYLLVAGILYWNARAVNQTGFAQTVLTH